MKSLSAFLCLALLSVATSFAQPTGTLTAEWQQSFGSNTNDLFQKIHRTSDGGFILIGEAGGIGGNKTSPSYGNNDIWVLRLNAQGNKVWEKSFGGTGIEFGGDIQQTAEGGFVLVTSSFSGMDGSKTSTNWGGSDLWVIRLDTNGNQLWERTFGGTSIEAAARILQTTNGGFIIGGSSIGAGGNKESSPFGNLDYWVVRLDSAGNKLWDRVFGGADEDVLLDLILTPDGGSIVCGYSRSTPGGNKTSPLFGSSDAWVVRLDASGNKLWERAIAGDVRGVAISVQNTTDGGFILGGETGAVTTDAWLIKLNASGTNLWSRAYGGSGQDRMGSVLQLPDGGFLFGGSSDSTDGDRSSPRFGGSDYWLVRTDTLGNKLWDLSLGGTNEDSAAYLEATTNGGFVIAGTSYSPVSGNKTSPSLGDSDYWLVKLGSEKPSLQIARKTGNQVELSWRSMTGAAYAITYSTNLATTNWFTLTNVTGNGLTNSVTDPVSGAQRFYRLSTTP